MEAHGHASPVLVQGADELMGLDEVELLLLDRFPDQRA